MRILTRSGDLGDTLSKLVRRCERLRWAVAWASTKAPGAAVLAKHPSKIDQLVVGIHFYQTDPDFIAAHLGHPNVRFVLNPSGVFHPKLYYFEQGDGRWSALIGSPNFTRSAFATNQETAVLIGHGDEGAIEAREEVLAALDRYAGLASAVDESGLEAYREMWRRQRRRLGPLSGTYSAKTTRSAPPSPLELQLFREDWRSFYRRTKKDPHDSVDERLAVLEEARRLFERHGEFSSIPAEARKGIAGIRRDDDLDWRWFGSMRPAGNFKQAVNQNNPHLSKALDRIPLSGRVAREDFEAFTDELRANVKGVSTATASRLLALKRPDYFVCLDSKNRKALCAAFGIPQRVELEQYWPKIVARLLDSRWWNAPEPSKRKQRRVWRCRAAMLDVRFYDPE